MSGIYFQNIGIIERFGHLSILIETRITKPFLLNPELLGLGRQIGQINSGAFGVFSAEISPPILVQ